MSDLRERVALLLYKNGTTGKSIGDYQWADCKQWYLAIADKVIELVNQEKDVA
jgi:hypothetical protein